LKRPKATVSKKGEVPPAPTRAHSSLVVDGLKAAPARAMLRAVGFQDADFGKSQIGVASTWSNLTPCNMHIAELAREAAAGVDAAGAKSVIFNTITVSGQDQVVDVQTVVQQQTLPTQVLDAIPTQGRLPQSYVVFLPGVVAAASGAGGQQGFGNNSNSLAIHGTRANESNVAIDGMFTRNISGVGGGNFWYYVNQGIVQEVVISTGGSGAEQQMSGIVTNVIPEHSETTAKPSQTNPDVVRLQG